MAGTETKKRPRATDRDDREGREAASGAGVAEADENVLAVGELVADRYRVERLIGKGGMGEVYAAHDLEKGVAVALKTVLRDRATNDRVVARFQQESELSGRISHRNVLRIHDVFEIERDGLDEPVPCMVMELLKGVTLSDRLQADHRLSTDEALPIVCQMASALAASHRAGVVHRDLKPDNVFLVPSDDGDGVRAVLTDFGVARTAPGGSSTFEQSDSLTATNVILGTPLYMAPEQLELEVATPATDIYTLGLVMYEMITGTLPFLAQSTLQTVFRRVREDPVSPREHVPELERVWEETILRCLARDPAGRFRSADEIRHALTGGPAPAPPPAAERAAASEAPAARRADPDRVPTTWIVAIFGVVIVIAVVILLLAS